MSEERIDTTADLFTMSQPRCKQCGSTNTQMGPGAGPHHARLVCSDCGRFLRWLPKPIELRELRSARFS